MPAIAELTVRIDVAAPPEESVTLAGLTVAVRFAGDTEVVSETMPANPFRLDREIVDALDDPAVNPSVDGLAEVVKSGAVGEVTVTISFTECEREPLVPATVTL